MRCASNRPLPACKSPSTGGSQWTLKLSRVKESQNAPLRRFAGKGGTGIRGRATGWCHDHTVIVAMRFTDAMRFTNQVG